MTALPSAAIPLSCLRHFRRRGLIAVIQCYLDDSGGTDRPVVTIAGFVGRQEAWERLECAYVDVFDGIPVFHTSDFATGKGAFKGWSKPRKIDFLNRVFQPAQGAIHGFSVSITRKAFEEDRRRGLVSPQASAYSDAFGVLAQDVLKKTLATPDEQVSFLVELGHANNESLFKFFKRLRNAPEFRGRFGSFNFVPKDECRAIQLADMYAYYSRRQMEIYARLGLRAAAPRSTWLELIQSHVSCTRRVLTNREIVG